VSLNHGYDGIQWYVPTPNLETACLALCVTCRDLGTSHVTVKDGTLRHLWNRRNQNTYNRKKSSNASSRIPAFKVRALTWELPQNCILYESRDFHAHRGVLALGLRRLLGSLGFGWDLSQPWWPDSLRKITFGSDFNHSVLGVVWPLTMEELVFGDAFTHSLTGVGFPKSLHTLTFGAKFNFGIDQMYWPRSLRRLTFG
ncbi:unnamed protein product, partial [Laminaria digitata]